MSSPPENLREPVVSPQPTFLLVAMSLLMIAGCAGLAGLLLWITTDTSNPAAGGIAALGCLAALWLGLLQTLGTFRPSRAKAIDAANWEVGVAALVAMHLAVLPMVSAQVIGGLYCLVSVGLIVNLALLSWLNLRWADELRTAGLQPAVWWRFSLRELLVLTLASAILLGAFQYAQRKHAEPAPLPASITTPGTL
ncbi:hypothetical protein ETAA8_11960 [Anatilimnocola aggregata]|uniref:Uncharacterized protein n=1 Tax=Anatilimnocola aggregata TaxID=2528021 RepID=A0A517Y7K3_9BACT|nr:hypothetical protein [Anatilimnocola aggregata]QDU26122.1 hypothetical protein ETAA8_11960 [Anatilimnocola aggregata]